MTLLSLRKGDVVTPYETYYSKDSNQVWHSAIPIPPTSAWVRTFLTYCMGGLNSNTRLMFKNMGMLVGRIHPYTLKPNLLKRYKRVRIYR